MSGNPTHQNTALPPLLIPVMLSDTASAATAGRLLVFVRPWSEAVAASGGQVPKEVDFNDFGIPVAMAAQEIGRIEPGEMQWIDADRLTFPSPLSALRPGTYAVQAVLDSRHDYNYRGRAPEDPVSPVAKLEVGAGAAAPVLVLAPGRPADGAPIDPPLDASAELRAAYAAAQHDMDPLDFVSPSLSTFWGRAIHIRGWVVRPPGYATTHGGHHPTVYWTHGFGEGTPVVVAQAVRFHQAMAAAQIPPVIYVLLDESGPAGTHEFADSVNNGPWGHALTTELIPFLEQHYRMDARPSGRLVTGHSSGGWASLWLQTRYPALFGGTWSTAPDPGDFRDFVGTDLYAPNANVYRAPNGHPNPAVRRNGKVVATFEAFAKSERVLGADGGQLSSFEWVFSPRGADGRPMPMFDRDTGAVDPVVVAYWRDHFDIAWRLARDWPALRPDLDGKINLIVGTVDAYYLDAPARRLKAVLDGLGAACRITFVEGRTHNDLHRIGDDPNGLEKQIAWEMWAVARPGSPLKPKP